MYWKSVFIQIALPHWDFAFIAGAEVFVCAEVVKMDSQTDYGSISLDVSK